MVQLNISITLMLGFVNPIVCLLFDLLGFDGSCTVASFLAFQVLSIRLVPRRIYFTIQFFDVSRLSSGSIGIRNSVLFGKLLQVIQLVTAWTRVRNGIS